MSHANATLISGQHYRGAVNWGHSDAAIAIASERCTECGQCLTVCPVSQLYPQCRSIQSVGQQDCVNCGACLWHCPVNTIDYQDDTQAFLQALAAGTPIALLAAPAVRRHFVDYRRVFGFLQSLGVRSFHNVLLRADITLWAYKKILQRYPEKPFISSPCAAVSKYIMQHVPALRSHLMPVHSPLLCAAVYLKKYQQVPEQLAFLSPCIAKREEFHLPGIAEGSIQYNVTIGKLKQYLLSAGIDLSKYETADFTDAAEGNGQTLGLYGGISEWLAQSLPGRSHNKISGVNTVYPYLTEYERKVRCKQQLPALLEVYNCIAGCDEGTGVGRQLERASKHEHRLPQSQTDERGLFRHFDRELNLQDFIR